MILFIKRDKIGDLIERFARTKYKHGDSELTLEHPPGPTVSPAAQPASSDPAQHDRSQDTQQVAALSHKSTNDLISNMIESFFDGRVSDAESAYSSAQKSEANAVERLANEALYLALRFLQASDESALHRLRTLSEREDTLSNPKSRYSALSWLATCYSDARRYDLAEASYRAAIEIAPNESDRVRCLASLTRVLVKLGDFKEGLRLCMDALGKVATDQSRADLWEVASEVEGAQGKKQLQAILLDKVSELKPGDSGALFASAYAMGQADFPLLSCRNYSDLLRYSPDYSMGANNLAVECQKLDMPIRSVSLYRKSENLGNTLSMANLAYLYLNAGFSKEATDIIEQARKKEQVHDNVARAGSHIVDRAEAEEKTWADIIDSATNQQCFLREYADASYLTMDHPDISGDWFYGDLSVSFVREGGRFIATWGRDSGARRLVLDFTERGKEVLLQDLRRPLFSNDLAWGGDKVGLAFLSRCRSKIKVMVIEAKTKHHFLLFETASNLPPRILPENV